MNDSTAPTDPSALLSWLLDLGIGGVGPMRSAVATADAARGSSASTAEAVQHVIEEHVKLAAAGGTATSVGGFPALAVMLPANLAAYHLVAVRMIAALLHLHGADVHGEAGRRSVLRLLADHDGPGAGSDPDEPRSYAVPETLRRLVPTALISVNKSVATRLLDRLTRSGKWNPIRLLPGLGGVIGGSVDAGMMRHLGDRVATELAAGLPDDVPARAPAGS